MTDLTQSLPPELLAEILERATIPDVLRFKLVKRAFRDVILASPLIQHKIELYAAGLEYNAAAGICLADSRDAFFRYRSNLESLLPVEKRTVDNLWMHDVDATSGGVYAIVKDSARLFTLGSASRGIPHREWEIPLPVINPEIYCLYPGDDVIAFVEQRGADDPQIGIQLRTLSGGGYHPDAVWPTICYSQKSTKAHSISSASITSSRLLVLTSTRHDGERRIIIWDWKRAQLLFELEEYHCDAMEFIDDYRFLLSTCRGWLGSPFLLLIDTEKAVGGAPVRTTLHLSTRFVICPSLLLERGMHKPSPAESLAPFYPDPAQRIAALLLPRSLGFPIFRVGALLELIESHEGSEIQWDEWKDCVVMPFIDVDPADILDVWVSGCRLFYIISAGSSPGAEMKVFDFSIQGRTNYSSQYVYEDLGGIRCLLPVDTRAQVVRSGLLHANGGHDSVILSYLPNSTGGTDEERRVSHIWTF